MAANIILATILHIVTIVFHAGGLILLSGMAGWLIEHPFIAGLRYRASIALACVALGLMLLLIVESAGWALAYVVLDVFADFETALYFSVSSFSTIGFGDVEPGQEWRVMAAIEGLTGFLVIGWTTAYLVLAGVRFGPFKRDMHF